MLQSIDVKGLVALARARDAALELLVPIGSLVVAGTPLFRVHGSGGAIDHERLVQVARRLRALLEALLLEVPEYRRSAVEAELALLDSGVGRSFTDPGDRDVAATRDRQGLGFGAGAPAELTPDER